VSRKRVLTSPGAAWVAAALGAWLVATACRSIQPTTVSSQEILPSPSLEGLVAPPVIRVGILPEVPRVSIGADAGVRILARGEGNSRPYWRPLTRATFVAGPAEGQVRLLETGEDLALATVVAADSSQLLDADARPYRGLLEVRSATDGSLTVVNVVSLEEYLRGVIPNELSPLAFPQIEAHKAQAVAARTWALAHLGDYSSKGYDVCATQACQVYRGQATEQPLSDQAVEQTRGIVATWRGRPIHAYYTSTCGGHTEDGDTIFNDRAPYLRGVVCTPERSARHSLHTTTEPRRDLPGSPAVPRSLAVLEALGVVDGSIADAPTLAGVPSDEEIRQWMERLQAALHRPECSSPVTGGLARRASLAEFGVASVCWRERAARLVAPGEADPLLGVADSDELASEGERQAVALLVHEGLLSPQPDDTLKPNGTVTRVEVLDLLAGLAERAGSPEWRRGEFASLAEGQLTVLRGEEADRFVLDPEAWLFRGLEGVHAGTSELTLTIGDELSYVTREGRVVYLEAHQTRHGAAPDRPSRYYRWEAQLTPADVARKVARYGSVGEVRDLVPQRLGVSGRVVELEVQGTAGELLLKGLKVRWGLGLRENLFVIDREMDAEGRVGRFVISGKGWGHGVGLCQVGAAGMAQAGSSYEGILGHYYTGIRLARAAGVGHP
jgi:stage II sporulation protein D